jgi:DNA-binding MarR family transcriptional regulator
VSVRRRNACLAAIECLRTHCGDVHLTDALAFFYVCENEGINISELAQLARLTPSSASRAARRLIAPDAPFALSPALDLLTMTTQPTDKRGRTLRLSPAGQRLRGELDRIIAAAAPIVVDPAKRLK